MIQVELVDVYNERHEKLNYTKERQTLIEGEYKLSCFVWVINDNDKILLQQRSSTVKQLPNMWGATAGCAQAGETSLDGTLRELKEELGIDATREEMVFIGSYKRINDFVEIWLCKKNIDIKELILDPTEVQSAQWFSIDEFEKMIINGIGIDSGFEIFKNYYNRYYEITEEKPVTAKN